MEFSLRAWRAGVEILAATHATLQHKFRPTPHYGLKSTSRAYNVARVALIHFTGLRREECLRKIVGTPRAAEILVDAFASDWEAERDSISAISSRSIEAFLGMFGNARELGWFVKAGMTLAEALGSTTTNGAALLGMEKSLGAISPGFYADIVAVEGDPLADIDVVINKIR